MGKVETIFKSEMVRLAKRETRKIGMPLRREVRMLKGTVSQLQKTVSLLERFAARQDKERASEKMGLQAAPEEVKGSRFSPRLILALRRRLGLTQKELATLARVTVGAIHQWEKGVFEPRDEKKGALVALRKLGRREVRKLLEESNLSPGRAKKSPRTTARRRKRTKRTSRR